MFYKNMDFRHINLNEMLFICDSNRSGYRVVLYVQAKWVCIYITNKIEFIATNKETDYIKQRFYSVCRISSPMKRFRK